MKTMIIALLVGGAGANEGETFPLDPEQVYAKKPSWSETMLATRANCAEWAKTATEHKLKGTSSVAVWRKIAKDWPVQFGWFTRDLPGGRHLDWFLHARDTSFERWIMRRWTPELGGVAAGLHQEFTDLGRAKIPPNDPRWLDLYGSACRWEEVTSTTGRLWLGELRQAFESQAAELMRAKTPCEDSRWSELRRQVAQCIDTGPVTHVGSVAELRRAIETLATTMPGRLVGGDQLLKQLAEAEPRWNGIVAGLLKQEPTALAQLPVLHREVRSFRHALLLAVRGMPEFLGPRSGVDLETEWEEQFASLANDLANLAWFDQVAPQTFRPESLIQPDDRDPADVVLRRTAALLADVKRLGGSDLADVDLHLAALKKAAAAISPSHSEARYVLYVDACRLRRQIAFRNPLLDFGQLLFVKHHRAIYPHMCDQYYGITAHPGGGLYVLDNPFGKKGKKGTGPICRNGLEGAAHKLDLSGPFSGPRVHDVLADSVVRNGRLKGQKLSGGPSKRWQTRYDGMGHLSGEETVGGSFLSPDLSYDGSSIVFAYVECTGDRNHDHHTDPGRGHWAEGRCYHIFKVNVDGSDLVQLTDGTWNDFDPRRLPNGRIAFVSERRGGYLRCGRVCPTYTLYDMAADGGDIRCLSPHETNEWHPSVTHNGRIVWTRWDYVDRHFSAAHMPWITTVDGRDPRPIHGNYAWRGSRPDMELNLRAIPNSPKFVATAAPHHGQAFGSLVIIDPRVRDDDGGSPLKRLTPEVGFPETRDGGTETFGAAWPLSEDYHLCVYDASMRRASPHAPVPRYSNANDGIYLVDAFGNRELVYRDPDISCSQPIPLRPRRKPPAVTDNTGRVASAGSAEATVAVMDVYESLKPWPRDTKITGLRVWQILPLSVAPAARNNGIQVPRTGSVNTGRAVLGSVPVEADGSAHFVIPAGKEVFFQALDERGLAVQSMRSGTHFQPGERHVCQGCHEPKHRAPRSVPFEPLATQRPPSRLQPDVDGTNPFSYARLVQPVLNKYCTDCHAQHPDKPLRLDAEPVHVVGEAYMDLPTTYYASYVSLAPQYGFYEYGSAEGRSHRTTPGEFGARASKLYALLTKGHYDVKLPAEDLHRLTVWLDSSSMFYGVYEKEGGEAQLRGEIVRPTLE